MPLRENHLNVDLFSVLVKLPREGLASRPNHRTKSKPRASALLDPTNARRNLDVFNLYFPAVDTRRSSLNQPAPKRLNPIMQSSVDTSHQQIDR